MAAIALRYVDAEAIYLTIPSDPDLVATVSSFISSLVEGGAGNKTGALELVIHEAISNAIFQGNLEVPSEIKSADFGKFYEIAKLKSSERPYSSRKVYIAFNYERGAVTVKVRDEGEGFDWRKDLWSPSAALDKPFGRGLAIMREFSSGIAFNTEGNEVTMFFNGFSLRGQMALNPEAGAGRQ